MAHLETLKVEDWPLGVFKWITANQMEKSWSRFVLTRVPHVFFGNMWWEGGKDYSEKIQEVNQDEDDGHF